MDLHPVPFVAQIFFYHDKQLFVNFFLLMLQNVRKSLQRNLYNFASSRWGAIILIIAGFITLNSMLHLLEAVIGIGMLKKINFTIYTAIVNKTTLYSDTKCDFLVKQYSDNIAHKEYQKQLCYEPIDIVYTWVNGSDPQHKQSTQFF